MTICFIYTSKPWGKPIEMLLPWTIFFRVWYLVFKVSQVLYANYTVSRELYGNCTVLCTKLHTFVFSVSTVQIIMSSLSSEGYSKASLSHMLLIFFVIKLQNYNVMYIQSSLRPLSSMRLDASWHLFIENCRCGAAWAFFSMCSICGLMWVQVCMDALAFFKVQKRVLAKKNVDAPDCSMPT